MWPRARRFGNVYAFATVDCLYAILWFSAWVAVANYVAEGKSIGTSGGKDTGGNTGQNKKPPSNSNSKRASSEGGHQSGCDAWAYGSAAKCNISTGTVILGVFIL